AGVSVFNPVPGGGTSASQRMTITPACSYVLSPSLPPNIGVNGGTASVRVTTTGGCAWTASSDTPWLKITSGASNTGTGNVSYSAEANPDASPRTGNMTIAGQSFTVTQSGSRGNPSPILDAVMPASVIAGGLGFTLTVTGSNFVANSVVNFRNSARPTTYISDTKLTARISATDISGGGSAAISVTNFASSGGTSSAVNLVIDPRPSITEAEPNDLPSQAQSIQIPYLINGTAAYGDWAGLVYSANGEADPIEDLYALTLPQTAQLDIRLAGNGDVELDLFLMRDDGGVISFLQRSTGATGSERIVTPLMPPGRYLVGVSSLSGAGTYQLQVGNVTSTTAQTPTITNAVLAPSLVVYGANFQSNSVIKINGVDAATTPISSTQLSASASGQAVNRVTVVSPNQPIGADQSNEVLVFPNSSGQRLVRVGNVFNTAQNAVKIPIELLALGGENSISFSVRFNKDLMTYRSAELAAGLNATLSVNTNQRSLGSLGFTITLPTGQSFLAGTRQLLSLNFTATPGTGGNITTLAFDDQPVTRSSVINFKTAAIPINQANGLPSLSGISPIEAKSGGEAFTLSVNGANFVYNSVVRWQGGNRTTSFVSPTQLTATIAAGDLLSVGTPAITVFNPAPGGGESNPLSFTINQFCNYVLQPTAQSFSGDGGTGSFSVTVTSGCEWTASGNANWIVITSGSGNGNGTVTFSIEPNPTTNQRSGVITVGGQSFNITQAGLVLNPPPTLSSLAPASVAGGGAAFTLSVSGANFVQSSVIQWNGENRPTVFVSGRQLNAQISAGDIAVAGTVKIAVFNPTPGGGRSAELPFSVTCGYTVQPTAQDFAPAGGSGTVRVSAPTGCAWTAAGNVSWIKVVSGANGSGAGEAVFSVEANTGAARTGTLTIAGEVFTVRQDCIVTAILTQPVSQTVCAGAPVTFSVMATSALPVSYQWRKNGVNLPAATSANFTIASAAASDAGDYSVVVAGACGTVTSSVATLIVNTPPVITSQPVNQIAPPGAGVTFTAAATGNPAPTVQWQVSADGVNFSNLPGATGSVLTLPNLTLALNGNRYRAVFANTCATVPSNVVTLTVACPTITLDPTSLPAATVGLPYNQPITAGGGSAPYSFSLNAQIPGLTLSASGALTGTPTQSGAFSFRVTATDANGCTAGRDYTLTASCIYDIAPQEQSFAAGGGNGSLTVTTAGGCAWQAVSNVSWIRITSGGGAGPGIVTFTVDANTEAARTGTLTVAGRTFTVRQACVETAII
ncbi:MAG TPA: BACON domain-containing carbohydrate-binding protein, partial [Blastocatellia bacterium]|nr:BACON domain-containing carbohydrate-binding protein [Blastocatellia bacterium]